MPTFGGQRVAMRQGDEVYYLSGDHLGSTSLTTDKDGNKVSEIRYLPYSQERWRNGNSVTDFGFTSQRNEAAFGLMDYNARYYNPTIGRFVSPDSIVPEPGSSGGFNRYRYTRNNPLKYVDPSGHCIPGLCPGQNVDYYNALMESSTGVDRYKVAIALNAALASAPDVETWNTDSLRAGIANDAHLIATKEGFYADTPSHWDGFLEDAAAAGVAIGANVGGSGDNYVPSNTFTENQKSDIFSDGGWVSGNSGTDFAVTPGGVAIPKDPQALNLDNLTDVSTSPATSRKFMGEDSSGLPIRIRIDKAHPEDPNFTGVPDPLHTVDHLHVERRKNGATGKWINEGKTDYEWPFD